MICNIYCFLQLFNRLVVKIYLSTTISFIFFIFTWRGGTC